MTKRKSPRKHRVKEHKRGSGTVKKYVRGSGTSRATRTIRVKSRITKEQREFELAAKKIDDIFNSKDYRSFVRRLGAAAKDPKVRAVLIAGRQDGMIIDDLVATRDIVRKSTQLQPIQREIDLAKSLKWVGSKPEHVPLILRGGTLGARHFAGNPIVTSKGKYIVDGHHRWSQVYMVNPDVKLESIDLNIDDPEKALRASQIAIATFTGTVPVQKVEKGMNIYDMSIGDIERNMKKFLTPAFYEAFYKTKPKRFKTKSDVHDHLLTNILRIRRFNKPATNITRGYMPQYSLEDVTRASGSFAKGEVNIAKPYVRKRK